MAHKTQGELAQILKDARDLVPMNARYTHFKDPSKEYEIVGHGIIEETEEAAVIYQAQYDERISFIRPITNFLEIKETENGPVARFVRVS